jgi:hypothetical protein
MTDRKFRVGDKVRWYEVGGKPLWNADAIETRGGVGRWVEGKVSQSYDTTILVDGQWWPQPDHCRALYGEPGYLELVEAVKEPRYRVAYAPETYSVYIETGEFSVLSLFPERCWFEIEALCAKLNEENQP